MPRFAKSAGSSTDVYNFNGLIIMGYRCGRKMNPYTVKMAYHSAFTLYLPLTINAQER